MYKQGNGLVIMLVVLLGLALVSIAFLIGSGYGKNIGLNLDLGEVITETREVEGFSKVVLKGCGNILVNQGEEEGLEIEAQEGAMEYITSEVKDNTLYLEYNRTFLNHLCGLLSTDINYTLGIKDFNGVTIEGSGSVVAKDIITDALDIKVEGSGNFEMTGTSTTQTIKIIGSGKYLAKDLVSQTTEIDIAGSGRIEVNVKDELDVDIAGSGNVYYIGQPKINQSIAGSGKIESF